MKKKLPDTFTIHSLGYPIIVTQVDIIDPSFDDNLQNESAICSLYVAASKEILIDRNLPEAQKYLAFFNCLGALAEETYRTNNPNNTEQIPVAFIMQFAFTILAGLVSSESIDISIRDFNSFFAENMKFSEIPN